MHAGTAESGAKCLIHVNLCRSACCIAAVRLAHGPSCRAREVAGRVCGGVEYDRRTDSERNEHSEPFMHGTKAAGSTAHLLINV